jgi:hypothetical protein
MSHDPQTETAFATYGDLGDIIYLCPSMSLVSAREGAPVTLFAKDGLRPWDPITTRLHLIAPLLESQPYIEAVLPYQGEPIDFDTSLFRDAGHPFGVTLASLQAAWLRLDPDFTLPWLKVTPNPQAPIVINRSARYHNHFFPWEELVNAFAGEMAFIGMPGEHEAFCHNFGKVNYLPTENLWKAAEVIAGSKLFIGNQSSCYAIAEALKHNSIQETDLSTPDCIFPRLNTVHCHDGALDFSFFGRRFRTKNRLFVRAHLNETPPGGWVVQIGDYKVNSYAFDIVFYEISDKLRQAGMEVPANLKEMIIEQNSTEHLDHPVARLKTQLHAV